MSSLFFLFLSKYLNFYHLFKALLATCTLRVVSVCLSIHLPYRPSCCRPKICGPTATTGFCITSKYQHGLHF